MTILVGTDGTDCSMAAVEWAAVEWAAVEWAAVEWAAVEWAAVEWAAEALLVESAGLLHHAAAPVLIVRGEAAR